MIINHCKRFWIRPLDGDVELSICSGGQPHQSQTGVYNYLSLSGSSILYTEKPKLGRCYGSIGKYIPSCCTDLLRNTSWVASITNCKTSFRSITKDSDQFISTVLMALMYEGGWSIYNQCSPASAFPCCPWGFLKCPQGLLQYLCFYERASPPSPLLTRSLGLLPSPTHTSPGFLAPSWQGLCSVLQRSIERQRPYTLR